MYNYNRTAKTLYARDLSFFLGIGGERISFGIFEFIFVSPKNCENAFSSWYDSEFIPVLLNFVSLPILLIFAEKDVVVK